MSKPLPFVRQGEPTPRTLDYSAFTAGSQVLSRASFAAYLDVALGHAMVIKPNTPFRLYLMAQYVVKFATDSDLEYAVDLGAAGLGIVRSARPAPDLPSQAHPDVFAFISADSGATWAATNVKAVDFTANTVTVVKAAGTNAVKVYYLPEFGEVALRVVRPAGSDSINALLWSAPLMDVHQVDQTNTRSAPTMEGGPNGNGWFLPPKFRLAIEVRSPSAIVWNAEAKHQLALSVADARIQVLNDAELNAMAEVQLRGGSI
ncbi:MAG TPA: hypothetical protein VHN99_12380 [Deinococcales bacterium]|nr:hypothetical protein [Deinococcales bacterium]